jgi:hypothetical protein
MSSPIKGRSSNANTSAAYMKIKCTTFYFIAVDDVFVVPEQTIGQVRDPCQRKAFEGNGEM